MNFSSFQKLSLIPLAGLAACSSNSKSTNIEKPNIIIILTDDLGFSDIGCYGSEISTPNLDKLAAEGVRCSHFYNASRCCPSRASLMTGLYPHQAGMGHMSFGLTLQPDNKHIESYQGHLPENVPTIANILADNNYTTCISGKWHIGDEEAYFPEKHGFQKAIYMPGGGSPYFSTSLNSMKLQSGEKTINYPDTNLYMTDIITDNAMQLIESVEDNNPFFLYLAYNAPHTPLQAPDSVIEKYMPIYKNGWEDLRNKRFEKLKEIGLIPDIEIPGEFKPYAGVDFNWDSFSEKEKWFLQRTMATYAAMIDIVDQNIGRLVEYLEKTDQLQNTVIFFLSDNGGTNESVTNYHKEDISMIPGNRGFTGGPSPWWGRLSNTPYRMYKAFSHEGGIASPLIAYGPKYFPKNKIINNTYFHIMDILPTCLELANTSYPETFKELPVCELFHRSMLSYLTNDIIIGDSEENRVMCWEHQGHTCVRKGDWKLTFTREYYYDNPMTKEHFSEMVKQWALYDLKNDPFENQNIIEQHPEKVEELKKDYDEWAKATGVVDWGKVNIW